MSWKNYDARFHWNSHVTPCRVCGKQTDGQRKILGGAVCSDKCADALAAKAKGKRKEAVEHMEVGHKVRRTSWLTSTFVRIDPQSGALVWRDGAPVSARSFRWFGGGKDWEVV